MPARRAGGTSRRCSVHAGPPRSLPRPTTTTNPAAATTCIPPPYTSFPSTTPLTPSLSLSRLVLGTMQFGEGLSEADSHRLCSAAVDAGLSSFDCAEMYPVPQSARTAGVSEAILGSWMKARKRRDDVQIITKVTGPGGMAWVRGGPPRLDGAGVRAALDGSLARLKTDGVDLLLLHWPDRYVPLWGETEYDVTQAYSDACPIEDAWEACERAVVAGKARAVGLSNETAWGLGRALAAARPPAPVAAIQNAYSLLARDFDATLAETCFETGVPLLAYAPLAGGVLSAKYRLGRRRPDGRSWWWDGPVDARFIKYAGRYAEGEARYGPSTPVRAAVAAYARLAREVGTTPAALALRWVLGRPLVGAAVLGVTGADQLDAAVAAAAAGPLDSDLLAAIDRVHARWPNPAP